MSLQYHPDKLAQKGRTLTQQDQAHFQRIKEVYDVLIDPDKRALYDQLGEKAMKWISDPMSSPDYPVIAFAKSNRIDRLSIVLMVYSIVLIPCMVPILFNLKIDQILNAPWTVIAIPVWIIDFVVLLLLGSGVYHCINPPPPPEGMSTEDPEYQEMLSQFKVFPALMKFTKFVSLVLFEILLAVRLDKDIPIDYAVVFIPLFLYEILGMATAATTAFMKIDNLDYSSEEFDLDYAAVLNAQKIEERLEARKVLWNSTLRIWLYIFIVLKVDNTVSWSWFLVFLPAWFALFSYCLAGSYNCMQAQFLLSEIKDEENPENPEEAAKIQAALLRRKAMAENCCTCCCLLLVVLLVSCRLSVSSFSSFYITLPIYLVIGLIFCCLCIGLCVQGDPTELDQAAGQGNYDPPAETEVTNLNESSIDVDIESGNTAVASQSPEQTTFKKAESPPPPATDSAEKDEAAQAPRESESSPAHSTPPPAASPPANDLADID
eukprot:CAMPEP_0117753016 /NCGR_PEP_ID=MMETSP0947-20121206/11971_1 /TAXON_ID=44440 /ORGANISM="Chattonella subsalsa, Strain CCMP2191" /LENGTH=489 /DNA_ID=CAMNT_0005571811 /DNA_START=322 /DNA_END=1791 /DNA_ORIENTATION=-